MRKMFWLRVLVIASAIVAIAYASVVLTDPVSTFWETLLVLVNIGQLTLTAWLDRRTQFDTREEGLRAAHFPRLAPSRLRRLLLAGKWMDLPASTRLTRAGDPVPALWFLHEGRAQVIVAGVAVGHCLPNSFIGEMTVATGEPAFADVVLDTDAVVWRIDAKRLRDLANRDPETGHALEAAFFRMIRQKLANSNDWSSARELQNSRGP
jgi:CRP-like cAMP-binding protein